jgi:hypothetical protein
VSLPGRIVHRTTESNSLCRIAVHEGAWISAPRLKGAHASSKRNRLIAVSWALNDYLNRASLNVGAGSEACFVACRYVM